MKVNTDLDRLKSRMQTLQFKFVLTLEGVLKEGEHEEENLERKEK